METAILVDWDLLTQNPYTQDFINSRAAKTRFVLLVTNPLTHDYDPDEIAILKDFEFDAVIRNSGSLPDVAFKATALTVLQDASNLVPVIALDRSNDVNEMYREGGVLITVKDL